MYVYVFVCVYVRVCVCGAGSRQLPRGPTQAQCPVGQGSAGGKPESSIGLIENR